jgi:hypothetical protein
MGRWETFKLRVALLKIWAVKNATVFLELFAYILIILVMTGQIKENTPIFVWFGLDELSVSMNDVITNNFNVGNVLLSLVTVMSSAIVIIGTVSTHSKRIALHDIKSPTLKRSLVRAGLYFNKEGKLVKRIEEAFKMDIDGDNKIGDVDVESFPKEGLFKGLRRSGEEFVTIVTFKPEGENDFEKIVEKTNMVDTAAALQSIQDDIKSDRKQLTLKDVKDTVDDATEYLQTEEGQAFQAKVVEVAQTTGEIVKEKTVKTGNFFSRTSSKTWNGMKVVGRAIGSGTMNGLRFIGSVFAATGLGIFRFISAIGKWFLTGFRTIGGGFKDFFAKLTHQKEAEEQTDALAKVLAAKKASKGVMTEMVKEVIQTVEVHQHSEIITHATPTKKVESKEDPLETLRKKYGR